MAPESISFAGLVFSGGMICLYVFAIGIFIGLLAGTSFTSGHTVGRAVQKSILRDLLATPAHERSNRVLDLCFFQLANKSFFEIDTDIFLTNEVIDHLEPRINDPAPIPRHNPQYLYRVDKPFESACDTFHAVYNVPSFAQPMDYEKGVLAVVQQIQKYKMERKSDDVSSHDDKLCARRGNGQPEDI